MPQHPQSLPPTTSATSPWLAASLLPGQQVFVRQVSAYGVESYAAAAVAALTPTPLIVVQLHGSGSVACVTRESLLPNVPLTHDEVWWG